MKVLNIYGQPMEHMEAEIIGTKEGLEELRDAIDKALRVGEASTGEMLFASDGEGYTVKIIRGDENWLDDFWKKYPAFYHRILGVDLTDEMRKCLVCGKEIEFNERCYQVRCGGLSEDDKDFIVEVTEGYAHETCLPLTPTM